MSQSDMPPSDTSSGTRRPRYAKDLPPKENHDEAVRDEIERRERLILPLARLRAAGTRIGSGEVEDVARQIGCKASNVQKMLSKYVRRMRTFEDQPDRWGDSLGDNRGRPEGTSETLDDVGKRAIAQALHDRDRTGVYADGVTKDQATLPSELDITEDIYEYALSICPTLPSLDTVRRKVRRLLAKDPSYFKLIIFGEAALRREDSPKLPFEVEDVDDMWGYDICDLPNYVNDDGVIATAAIIRLIDYKSDYRIHQRLIPKKEKDENGTLLGVSFKKTDVIVFFVSAMWKVKRRPRFVYADNDDRLDLKDEFPYVTEPAEKPIDMISPRPGEPWPRGLQEGGFSRSQIRLLRRYTGYYIKKNRSSIRKAIANPAKLPTPKQMEEQVAAFDENMNKEPRVRPARGKATGPTRADIYNQHINPRPCPPIRRLFRIMPTDHREEGWVQLDGLGFDFSIGGEKHFVPVAASKNGLPDLWIDWMDAKLSKEPSHYFAIKLDMGWVAEICLMGHWYEAVPRSKNPYDRATRKQAIDDAVSKLKQRASDEKAKILAEALERDGALPERDNVSVRGEYHLPSPPSLQGDHAQGNATPPPASTNSDGAQAAESGGETPGPGAQSEQGKQASATGKPSQRRKRSTSPSNGEQATPAGESGGEASGAQSEQGKQARATGQSSRSKKRSPAQQNGEPDAPRKTKLDWDDLF